VQRVANLPGVLQHNDLGSWNVVVDGDEFVVLDWESAQEVGLPLWDTLYFLADALALVDRATDGSTRHEHTTRLFRGDLESSALLFRLIGRSVDALGIPPEAVGPLAALCWMHHAQSPVKRATWLAQHLDATTERTHGTELTAEAWLSDPALGTGWPAWRRACAIG
jgi:Phosphotransferase enzyme family